MTETRLLDRIAPAGAGDRGRQETGAPPVGSPCPGQASPRSIPYPPGGWIPELFRVTIDCLRGRYDR